MTVPIDTEGAQGATDTTSDGAQSTPEREQTVTAEDLRALKAELEKAQLRIKSLSDENGRHRNRAKDEEAAKLDAARKAGELEPVVKTLEERLAALEPLAALGERARQRLESRLEADSSKLPEDLREKLSRITDLEQREAALDIYLAAVAKKPASAIPSEGSVGGPPSPLPSIQALLEQGIPLNTIKAEHPQVWEEQRGRFAGKTTTTSAARFFGLGRR